MTHPRDVLLGPTAATPLPVCDHYCGVQARMVKSLALQAELSYELGTCAFDVTLDCEDGAPVGGEKDHARMVAELVESAWSASQKLAPHGRARIAARVHPVDHPAFAHDVATIVGRSAQALCHVMIPKVDSVADIELALIHLDQAANTNGRTTPLPLHVLIESPLAVHHVAAIAAHPRVESLSFGLMDFVSSHGGAIPASAMGTTELSRPEDLDQFSHPLVVRAKLAITGACHAFGKTASHGVVTEFKNVARLEAAARHASRALGFGRMWSIHPDQIRPILAAFSPAANEVDQASRVVCAAHAADWAPISLEGHLHDRASYRYFWQVLVRAHQTAKLPAHDPAQVFFSA
ncbi:MAG: aldolase/citrate lyase family protein [Rhodoferax sp.]|uniref:HpcH/HpaI aldolase/citrate lyase family protein n=1 Tax=Rhodoferax sp. TaxID=50421 RepID=UPI0008D65493|nr:aldolase/citrate lyase family protein [Rhodoferax sp.]OGB41776.1 MAG: aldolase [Burkholderiales bacterium RIFOXYC2_FULL_59_8]OGB51352.1 MAG: aldolase [Burkholderiales bacterium RIFOXYD12_FULL_59_19]OGB80376.1 MAG: aldolase [Burkholderiales bacterium RIFOXYC12_FULL_60_6]OGB83261.1 MAG: aldolase [Burkholderiales bacterium RIFOXYD2_FULL_59_8]MDP2680201.1 aldolase/citrate lyase family protein [Rhodoferax sp.]